MVFCGFEVYLGSTPSYHSLHPSYLFSQSPYTPYATRFPLIWGAHRENFSFDCIEFAFPVDYSFRTSRRDRVSAEINTAEYLAQFSLVATLARGSESVLPESQTRSSSVTAGLQFVSGSFQTYPQTIQWLSGPVIESARA